MLYNSVSLPDMLLSLINEVKKAYMPHWILVLPLLHLLKGTSKPFEASSPGKLMNVPSWAGLEGIDDLKILVHMSGQNRKYDELFIGQSWITNYIAMQN